jgi:hypothetical protein
MLKSTPKLTIRCRLMTRCISLVVVISNLFLLANSGRADELFQLMATIEIERDSTEITSVEPIGDFNADGYGDIAIGVFQEPWNIYEAVYLYYGGPSFDENPDLVFMGDPQNEDLCGQYTELPTAYGWETVGLGDFNADGFDDFAVSAAALCSDVRVHSGRVYIYFGSPDPDTTVDIVIDGERDYDGFGETLCSGDFNGDDLGDLFSNTIDEWIGQKLYVFLGANPPDNQYDWLCDYSETGNSVSIINGGFDINGDGFQDFCWLLNADLFYGTPVMLGSDPLNQTPTDTIFNAVFRYPGDVSRDGIDDFMISIIADTYLCLGGEPLDIEPDYSMPRLNYAFPFIYDIANDETVLMVDCRANPHPHSLLIFNTGVPFDTIPHQIIDYGQEHGRGRLDIGDVNGDGIEDLAMSFEDSTLHSHVNIYSLIPTGIRGDGSEQELPFSTRALFCYPNPFNNSVKIAYIDQAVSSISVEISIYSITGEVIRKFKSITMKGGECTVEWDGTDQFGSDVSSGIYFVAVSGKSVISSAKIVYLR